MSAQISPNVRRASRALNENAQFWNIRLPLSRVACDARSRNVRESRALIEQLEQRAYLSGLSGSGTLIQAIANQNFDVGPRGQCLAVCGSV
jgi:hypothetical protein